MNRRNFLKHSTLGVAFVGQIGEPHRPQPNLPSIPQNFTAKIGDWDEPPAFTFATGPQGKINNLYLVGFLAKYHGKEYGERVYLPPNYTLSDVVDAVTTLRGLANDTLNYLIQGQL